MQCTAEEGGDFWAVSGEKMDISNAPGADFGVARVRTHRDGDRNGMPVLLIRTATPGFSAKETLRKLVRHLPPTSWLAFDRCPIPKAFTLGKPHLKYYYYHSQNLLEERLVGEVASLVFGDLVLDGTMGYVRERMARGRRLSSLQTIRQGSPRWPRRSKWLVRSCTRCAKGSATDTWTPGASV